MWTTHAKCMLVGASCMMSNWSGLDMWPMITIWCAQCTACSFRLSGAVIMHIVPCCEAMYHLDILAEVPLEAAKQDLPLTRLETIQHGGDGALKVGPRKQDQLLQQFGHSWSMPASYSTNCMSSCTMTCGLLPHKLLANAGVSWICKIDQEGKACQIDQRWKVSMHHSDTPVFGTLQDGMTACFQQRSLQHIAPSGSWVASICITPC